MTHKKGTQGLILDTLVLKMLEVKMVLATPSRTARDIFISTVPIFNASPSLPKASPIYLVVVTAVTKQVHITWTWWSKCGCARALSSNASSLTQLPQLLPSLLRTRRPVNQLLRVHQLL